MKKKTIDELKEKNKFLELEIEFLKKTVEETRKNNDIREKALKLEIIKESGINTNKKLATLIPFVGIILAIFGFLGYENIKTSLLNKIDIEPLKNKVLITAREEIQDVQNTKTKILHLEKEVNKLLESTKKYYNDVSSIVLDTEDFENNIKSLNDTTLLSISDKYNFKFLNRLGLSTELILLTLNEEQDLSTQSSNRLYIRKSISVLQGKYGLRPDGIIGPATSLLIAILAVQSNEERALREIKENNRVYLLSYQYLFREPGLFNIIKDEDNSLHLPTLKILEITDGIHSKAELLSKIDRY